MRTVLNREPALILAAVQALLTVLVVFGFDLTDEQQVALLALTGAFLALATRSRVIPLAKFVPFELDPPRQ